MRVRTLFLAAALVMLMSSVGISALILDGPIATDVYTATSDIAFAGRGALPNSLVTARVKNKDGVVEGRANGFANELGNFAILVKAPIGGWSVGTHKAEAQNLAVTRSVNIKIVPVNRRHPNARESKSR